jgi:hypothetical protein
MLARLKVTICKRSHGRTATASAAYRCGLKILDERSGKIFDFSARKGVISVHVVGWMGDVSSLANAMEYAEKRRDSRVGRDIVIALPPEASCEKRRKLALQMADFLYLKHLTPMIIAIHGPNDKSDPRNHHAHIFMATRRSHDGLKLSEKATELDTIRDGPRSIEGMRVAWGRIVGADMRSAKRQASDPNLSESVREAARQRLRMGGEPKMGNPFRRAEMRRIRKIREEEWSAYDIAIRRMDSSAGKFGKANKSNRETAEKLKKISRGRPENLESIVGPANRKRPAQYRKRSGQVMERLWRSEPLDRRSGEPSCGIEPEAGQGEYAAVCRLRTSNTTAARTTFSNSLCTHAGSNDRTPRKPR